MLLRKALQRTPKPLFGELLVLWCQDGAGGAEDGWQGRISDGRLSFGRDGRHDLLGHGFGRRGLLGREFLLCYDIHLLILQGGDDQVCLSMCLNCSILFSVSYYIQAQM